MPREEALKQAGAKLGLDVTQLDLTKLDWVKVAALMQLLIQICADLFTSRPPVVLKAGDSQCDHAACCQKTLTLQLAAAQACVEHLHECCPCPPCPPVPPTPPTPPAAKK